MQSEKPLFSIVVPIYNEEQFLCEALDSIATQTDPDWEALLIDDGSTDSTPGILDEYSKNDSRFRVFHKSNGGQSSAINLGVQEARGGWLCWLSGDDYFHPQKLEINRRWIQDYPDKKFFFTGFWLIEPDGKKIEYDLNWLDLENSAYHLIQLFRANYVMGISICIKREFWLKNGEFNEKLRYAHDLDMWLRLMLNTPTQYIPERTCTMRSHSGQESAKFPLAGLFDSSKSAIHILNNHTFAELFPGVDLKNHQTALDILSRTLDFVACESTSNFYMLGYHPLLQLRILEWVWEPDLDPALASNLQKILQKRASKMATRHGESPFGLLWKATRAAIKSPRPHFRYFPSLPGTIGKLNYFIQKTTQAEIAQPLRTYLERFEHLNFEDEVTSQSTGCQLVLLLPPEVCLDEPEQPKLKIYREIWQYLARTGFSILLVGKSQFTFGLVDGLLYLGAETVADQKQLIMALGNLDTIVTFADQRNIEWARAERVISIEPPKVGDAGSQIATDLLEKIQSTPRQKHPKQEVVFIARTLWGGGTEKVLYELAHYLDPDRFTPTVLYFLDQENPVAYDPSISTICLESMVVRPTPPPEPVVVPSTKQKISSFLLKAYYVIPGPVREKISLHQRLRPVLSFRQVVFNFLRKTYYAISGFIHEKISLHRRLHLVSANNTVPLDTPKTPPEYGIFDAILEVWPEVTGLRKALDGFSQDAVLIPMEEFNTVILWLSQLPPYRKVLASQHAPYSQAQLIRYPEKQVRRVKEWLYLNACRAADVVIFPSERARVDLINNFQASPSRTLYMPNLIDCEATLQKSRQPLPENLNLSKRKTVFTQIARLSYEKNPLLLVEACDLLRQKYDDFVVLYVGDGPLYATMCEKIDQKNLQDHILLLGEQANPYPYIAAARSLLLTSYLESFGLVIAEAMLCGAVPITTDCGGPRELLNDGEFGMLVPLNNPQAFADAMYKIATDDNLYSQLREGAQSWVLRFDAPRVIKEWEELILRVIEHRIDDRKTKINKDDEK